MLDVHYRGVTFDERHRVFDVYVSCRNDVVAQCQGLADLLGRQIVFPQLVRIDVDDDRTHVGAERRDGHRAGNVFLHQRPHDVLGQIAHVAQRGFLALEDEIADGNAAGVHTHDHGWQGALGHPRHGSVGHGHDLGHRLPHVGAGEERQFAQGDLLDIACVDVLNAIDVLEVEFELVDDEPSTWSGLMPT